MEFLREPQNLIQLLITLSGFISMYIRLNNKIIVLEEFKKNSIERSQRKDGYDTEFRREIKADINKILDKLENIKNGKS